MKLRSVVFLVFFVFFIQGLSCGAQEARRADDPREAARRRALESERRGEPRRAPAAERLPEAAPSGEIEDRIVELVAEGRDTEALRLVDEAERESGPSARLFLARSSVYVATLRPRLAAECAERARHAAEEVLRSAPGDRAALAARATALVLSQRFEEAAAAIGVALEAGSDDVDLKLAAAGLRIAARGAGDPRRELDSVAPRNSASLRALMTRASLEKNLGLPGEAVKTLEFVLRARPGLPGALANMAACMADLGSREREYGYASQALTKCPDHVVARVNQAEALIHLGGAESAIGSLDLAIARQEDLSLGHFLKGIALLSLGRNAESIRSLETAIAQWDRDADYHANLAKVAYQTGDFARALRACDAALKLDPGLANTHADRATVLNSLGRYDDAILAADAALRIEPANPYARNAKWVALSNRNR